MLVKFIVQSIVLLALNASMQYYLHESVESAQAAMDTAELHGIDMNDEEELLLHSSAYAEFAEKYYESMEGTRMATFISFLFFMPVMQELLFAVKTKRHYNLFQFENILRTVFFVTFFIVSMRHYMHYEDQIHSETDASKEV